MEMAKIGPGVAGGNNRQTLTDDDAKGRALFQKWCEAAGMVMGASRLLVFRKITLPLLRPAILVGGLFSFLISFDEVVMALDESTALFEARRCLSCGNCFECDNCYGVCPDNAVIKLGPGKRFQFNLDYCKGCGLCAAECPCGAITMVPETV